MSKNLTFFFFFLSFCEEGRSSENMCQWMCTCKKRMSEVTWLTLSWGICHLSTIHPLIIKIMWLTVKPVLPHTCNGCIHHYTCAAHSPLLTLHNRFLKNAITTHLNLSNLGWSKRSEPMQLKSISSVWTLSVAWYTVCLRLRCQDKGDLHCCVHIRSRLT